MSGSMSGIPPQLMAYLQQMQQRGGGGTITPGPGVGGMPQNGPMSAYIQPQALMGAMGPQGGMMQRPPMPGMVGQGPQPQGIGQQMGQAATNTAPLMQLLAQMKQGQSGVQAPNGQGGGVGGVQAQQQPGGVQGPGMAGNPQFLQWLQSQMGQLQQPGGPGGVQGPPPMMPQGQ